jgi:hypothetical protein
VTFLLGLVAVFVVQLITGIRIVRHEDDPGAVSTIAVLVVVCFLLGVSRAWELIGGPDIGLRREIGAFARKEAQPRPGDDAP